MRPPILAVDAGSTVKRIGVGALSDEARYFLGQPMSTILISLTAKLETMYLSGLGSISGASILLLFGAAMAVVATVVLKTAVKIQMKKMFQKAKKEVTHDFGPGVVISEVERQEVLEWRHAREHFRLQRELNYGTLQQCPLSKIVAPLSSLDEVVVSGNLNAIAMSRPSLPMSNASDPSPSIPTNNNLQQVMPRHHHQAGRNSFSQLLAHGISGCPYRSLCGDISHKAIEETSTEISDILRHLRDHGVALDLEQGHSTAEFRMPISWSHEDQPKLPCQSCSPARNTESYS